MACDEVEFKKWRMATVGYFAMPRDYGREGMRARAGSPELQYSAVQYSSVFVVYVVLQLAVLYCTVLYCSVDAVNN